MKQKTIGSILLDVELVTQEDIDQALELQKQTGQRLGEVLVSLGVVSDDDIRWALAEQLNLPYVNIRKDQIDTDVAMVLPEKLARRYHVIPILKIDDELTVVVDDPLNTIIIKDIEAITNSRVKVSLGRTSDILLAIDEIYGHVDEDLQKTQETPPRFLSVWFSEEDCQKILNDPSGHALIDTVLENAFTHEIMRIYFQPGFKTCSISYRLKGVLQHQVELDREWYSIALFRLKISAGIELSKIRSPVCRELSYWDHVLGKQSPDGKDAMRIALSIFPTEAGESAVLQVINKPLEKIPELPSLQVGLPFPQKELQDLKYLQTTLSYLKAGAFLLAGTPYADKMTTLYTLLQGVDSDRRRVVTFESYTEYSTDKYTQIRYGVGESLECQGKSSGYKPENPVKADQSDAPVVNNAAAPFPGDSLQQVLSSWIATVNQQDADVILVDRIGTQRVLEQSLDLAAHHLFLGAFEFQRVFEIVAFCLDCHIKPSVLASRVSALIGQQTVHLLCPQCKQADTTEFARQFVAQLPQAVRERYPAPITVFAPRGCPACYHTGYSEQVILYELLKMEPWLKDLFGANAPLSDIRKAAEGNGFVPLEQKSIELVLTGRTSIEQILSMIS